MSAPPRGPWGLLRRDQVALYALCLLLLACVALRYGLSRWAGAKPVRKLEPGDRIAYHVDLNTADAAELDLLPGIGPAKAERIVAYRDAHGPFERVDDLAGVPGISADTVEKLRHLVSLSPVPSGGEPLE